jgi:hypothetical protein
MLSSFDGGVLHQKNTEANAAKKHHLQLEIKGQRALRKT